MISLVRAPWESQPEQVCPELEEEKRMMQFITVQTAPVLRQTVASHFKMTAPTAERILRRLVAKGQVEIECKTKSRSAKYRAAA